MKLLGSLSAAVDEALCKNRDKLKDLTPYIIQQTHDSLYNSCFLHKGYLNNKHHSIIEMDLVNEALSQQFVKITNLDLELCFKEFKFLTLLVYHLNCMLFHGKTAFKGRV